MDLDSGGPLALDVGTRLKDFDEVPAALLDAKSWRGVVATSVQGGRGSLGLEADALVVACEHLLRSSACRGMR
eukprot:8534083-Pyramimonas_sp.AAC.1